MAKTTSLKAEDRKRTGTGVLKQMRREGFIPSVVYGGGYENRNVKVNAKEFTRLVTHSASANFLVNLDLDGGNRQLAFVQDLQHDPLSGAVLHADFLAVGENTEITAQIPIDLLGEPAGVKHGGVLDLALHAVEITCLPKDLPETVEVDVEHLEIGDAIHIGELKWPDGVAATLEDEVVVASVIVPRLETEGEAEGELEEGLEEPEVQGEVSEGEDEGEEKED